VRTCSACLLLSFVLAALVVGGCAGPQGRTAAVDTAAISAAVDSFIQAHNAAIAVRDTDAIVALYTDDAMVFPAGAARVDGREAIRAMWAKSLRAPGLELSMASQHKLVAQAGDMVSDMGTYDFRMSGPDGRTVHDVGKYVTVMKKVDGRWKMVVDIWNSDPPPPPAK
jgi:uncharacterized protein (TIGR02246 family)